MPRFALDIADFMTNYWQKAPCFLPQALPGFTSPLQPEELAGLALEPDIESRLISYNEQRWELQTGPFDESDFQRHDLWTLLVQGVDRLIPQVANLKRCVDFIPSWRFDDVMVSYAVDGGSVGPHFDRYDVFLLQGLGERRWQLGEHCNDSSPRLEHDSLNLLKEMEPLAEYLLKSGDVLYVPPGVAHWGVAQGECMTYSIGFRAPPISHLLARMTDHLLDQLEPTLLLEDGASPAARRPGELTAAQINNAQDALSNTIKALDTGAWFAEVLSESNHCDAGDAESPPMLQGELALHPESRALWIDRDSHIDVYCAGRCFEAASDCIPMLESLCSGENISAHNLTDNQRLLLEFLTDCGALFDAEW